MKMCEGVKVSDQLYPWGKSPQYLLNRLYTEALKLKNNPKPTNILANDTIQIPFGY
jgi:hypothetical protein